MNLKARLKEKLNKHSLTRRFLDYDFRTVVFTVVSLVFIFAYAAFYAMLGIALRSVWYGVLACYYIMIVVMRALVVFYHGRKRRRKERAVEEDEKISRANIYLACGIIICLLTLPLSIVILLMVGEKATFSHAGLMIYVAAVYTVFKVVMAIRHVVKARRSYDLTVRTVRGINLADMFVSILALQTAMFNSFPTDMNTGIFNGVTGAAVCVATVIIGAFMIAGSRREVIRIRYEANLLKNNGQGDKE